MVQNNTNLAYSQDSFLDKDLVDISTTGKDRKWKERKMANELLAKAYDSVNPSKAARLRDCAKVLRFRVYNDGTKLLETMNSCRVRLCPICSWRRSLKIFYNTKKIIDYLVSKKDYSFLFLTLTIRNVTSDELNSALNSIFEGFNRFMQLKQIKAVSKGWYRGLEITHDTEQFISAERYKRSPAYYDSQGLYPDSINPLYDTFHPHLHIVIAVNKSYFTDSKVYLSQQKFTDLWRQSMRVDYNPIVDVRKVKPDLVNGVEDFSKAVAEVSKYASKSKDYIIPDDWNLTVETVRLLDSVLANRRLTAYGGAMREANKILKLDDIEDGSLVDVGDAISPDGDFYIESYFWYSGYNQYYRID